MTASNSATISRRAEKLPKTVIEVFGDAYEPLAYTLSSKRTSAMDQNPFCRSFQGPVTEKLENAEALPLAARPTEPEVNGLLLSVNVNRNCPFKHAVSVEPLA